MLSVGEIGQSTPGISLLFITSACELQLSQNQFQLKNKDCVAL